MFPEQRDDEGFDEMQDAPELHEAFRMLVREYAEKVIAEDPARALWDFDCQSYISFHAFCLNFPTRKDKMQTLVNLVFLHRSGQIRQATFSLLTDWPWARQQVW